MTGTDFAAPQPLTLDPVMDRIRAEAEQGDARSQRVLGDFYSIRALPDRPRTASKLSHGGEKPRSRAMYRR